MKGVGLRRGVLAAVGLLLLCAAAASAGGSGAPGPAEAPPVEVRTRGTALFYAGPITPEGVARARALLEASPQVRELVVHSGGGDVVAGMDLGDLVHARGLDVRVSGGLCMSSCANYVFTAGRRKTIEPGSLVVWHGSMLQEGLLEQFDPAAVTHHTGRRLTWWERRMAMRAVRRDYERVLRRQNAFYARIGVDGTITVIGQRMGCGCQWTLAVEDMAAFGVRDVSAPDDYAQPGYGADDFPWELLRLGGDAARG